MGFYEIRDFVTDSVFKDFEKGEKLHIFLRRGGCVFCKKDSNSFSTCKYKFGICSLCDVHGLPAVTKKTG